MTLSPAKVNRVIAEVMGWKVWSGVRGRTLGTWCDTGKFDGISLPNFFASLDACAEFEKSLDDKDTDTRSLWLDQLAIACDWPETKNAGELKFEVAYRTARATAPQRCLAFIRVLAPTRVEECYE